MASAITGSRIWRVCARAVPTFVITMLGLVTVTFLIGRVMPIDPVLAIVGDRASAETYEQVRLALGLDQPLWRQYLDYLAQVARGDFGNSVLTAKPVLVDMADVFPATLELATVATLLGTLIGIPLGVLAATHQGRWPDHAIRVVGLFGHSVPTFWISLIAMLVFYARLGWLPGPGRINIAFQDFVDPITGVIIVDALLQGEWDAARSAAMHIIMPAGVLAYFSLAYVSRMTRSFMIEQLRQEYVTAARVKGASETRVVWRHALGNAAAPLATVIALTYANLLEGAVLTETVFAWPGLGLYLTNSLLSADMNAVLGATIVVGLVVVGLNLVADLLQTYFDPRIR